MGGGWVLSMRKKNIGCFDNIIVWPNMTLSSVEQEGGQNILAEVNKC